MHYDQVDSGWSSPLPFMEASLTFDTNYCTNFDPDNWDQNANLTWPYVTLQPHKFNIQHKPGDQTGLAGYLSCSNMVIPSHVEDNATERFRHKYVVKGAPIMNLNGQTCMSFPVIQTRELDRTLFHSAQLSFQGSHFCLRL